MLSQFNYIYGETRHIFPMNKILAKIGQLMQHVLSLKTTKKQSHNLINFFSHSLSFCRTANDHNPKNVVLFYTGTHFNHFLLTFKINILASSGIFLVWKTSNITIQDLIWIVSVYFCHYNMQKQAYFGYIQVLLQPKTGCLGCSRP